MPLLSFVDPVKSFWDLVLGRPCDGHHISNNVYVFLAIWSAPTTYGTFGAKRYKVASIAFASILSTKKAKESILISYES